MAAIVSYNRNRWVAYALTGVAAAMVGAAYAAVPIYALFCQITGYGGTTQVATEAPLGVISRQMTVRFDSNVANELAWDVTPAASITGSIGEVETINFMATNLADKPVSGTAVFNVTPEKAGIYFNKLECFCFTQQTLAAGETVAMPVQFFVDPEIDQDNDLETIREITLSYTFYPADNEGS